MVGDVSLCLISLLLSLDSSVVHAESAVDDDDEDCCVPGQFHTSSSSEVTKQK